jgi:hypothetical protein
MMLGMHPWTGLSDDVRLGVLTEWVTCGPITLLTFTVSTRSATILLLLRSRRGLVRSALRERSNFFTK